MRKRTYVGSFELIAMLAVMRLGSEAYGVPIFREIEEQCGREISLGSVYAALDRLEEKGFVASQVGESTPERGGRAKKYFRTTPRGLREVKEAQRILNKMWHRLPELEGGTI